MSRLLNTIRQIFNKDSQPPPEDYTLPVWRELCGLYFIEPDENEHFEYDVVVRVVNVSPRVETISIVLSCLILRSHPASKGDDYVRKEVEITFHGVVDPSVTLSNEPLPRNKVVSLAYEAYYALTKLEVKPNLSGVCSVIAGQETYDYHLILFASSLKIMFPFKNLSYRELTDAEYIELIGN